MFRSPSATPLAFSDPVADAIRPAAKLPVADAKNQVPMIRLAICAGASRFIALSPTQRQAEFTGSVEQVDQEDEDDRRGIRLQRKSAPHFSA